MNILHICNDCIITKLNDIIELMNQSSSSDPGNGLFKCIIALIVCAAIVIIALHFINKFFEWKNKVHDDEVKQKKEERTHKEDEKILEQQKEYRTKIHEYLKEETNSYSKLLKELEKKKKKNEEKFKEIDNAIENVKQELVENRFIATSTCSQIIDQLYSIKKKMNDLEVVDTTEKTDWNNWDKFHESLKHSEYLNVLAYFLQDDDKRKVKE